MEEEDTPVRDYHDHGSSVIVDEDDIQGHHSERWQHLAMINFPQNQKPENKRHHKRHHHRRRHHRNRGNTDAQPEEERPEEEHKAPLSSACHHVHFLLGDPDEEHESHDVFCELQELRRVGDDMEWKETARWIKFEEDVEEGGERWSKPFVATLALHSLFELRKGMVSGTVILDMDATNLLEIIDLLLDKLISTKQLDEDLREDVQEVLLAHHHHQHEKDKHKSLPIIRSLTDIGRRFSDWKLDTKDSNGHLPAPRGSFSDLIRRSSSLGLARSESGDFSPVKFNEHFAKKIPPGAETANIMVGEVDFLSEPISAFVRISKAVMLGDLTEVPVPTRFIYLLLGPTGHHQQYHEIGRSIATLMSDEVFHEIAYKAKNRDDLLAAIDEFLDQVTVLPPGEWDPTIRIEPPKSVPSQEGRRKSGVGGNALGLPNGMGAPEEEEKEEHGDNTLIRTGRLFGGLITDVKRKAPLYLSDFKDVLHVQCIASFFFMYFACLTPIITFGGLLGAATNDNMAAMESLLSGAICGVSYHLFAGQPLTILGSTGPILVFETILYGFCSDNQLDYLGFRFWIGIWVCVILIVIVAFDLSALVRYITRFTEESFATLIALIYIYEAFKKLFHILDDYPVTMSLQTLFGYRCICMSPNATLDYNMTTMSMLATDSGRELDPNGTMSNISMTVLSSLLPTTMSLLSSVSPNDSSSGRDWSAVAYGDCEDEGGILVGPNCAHPRPYPDVFFFSCLLFIGTFTLAYSLKHFRNSRYFPSKIRGMISDFAVMTAIAVMVTVDAIVRLNTPKLNVPEDFKPTKGGRGWVINPFVNPMWTLPAAILPALLATILIFMDQQITAVIINRKEYKLKKGCGYHLDLFIIAIQIALCSVLGSPWFVAATVLSINHVHSLRVESQTSAPGESAKFLGIREQRVTGILVFLFVGVSVMLTSLLKHIPMAVLYGVFLYMGVSSLNGVQLMQRIGVAFMPAKYQPNYVFLQHVPLRRIHLFTFIQVFCLAILWVVKTFKSISIIFPIMVLAMCFVRKALDWVFTHHELKWLDDIMPESHKRERQDRKEKEKKLQEEQETQRPDKIIELTGGLINIPLQGGQSIKVPVNRITYDPLSNEIQISQEMGQTAIWKQLVANEIQDKSPLRNRKNGKKDKVEEEADKSSSGTVKFTIAEEEMELKPKAPIIKVSPPANNGAYTNHGFNDVSNV